MRVSSAIVIFTGFQVAGLFVVVHARFQRDIHSARKRISVGSQLVETPCGQIEYGVTGNGSLALVVHGAGGGYDQGLDLAEPLIWSGWRVIAMSRFGYLRTPLPTDASPAGQADAHVYLVSAPLQPVGRLSHQDADLCEVCPVKKRSPLPVPTGAFPCSVILQPGLERQRSGQRMSRS